MRPICEKEGCGNLAKPNGYNTKGERKFYKLCSPCRRRKSNYKDTPSGKRQFERLRELCLKGREERRPYRQFVKDYCEECGFIAVHKCQLDVDHIYGNHENNEESNLQTLCANCHRLKTS